MHLKELHGNQGVSAKPLSSAIKSTVISIQILQDQLLKEHTTPTPAILVCVEGCVEYGDENGEKTVLRTGETQSIEPHVKHWVTGIEDAQLLLIK